MFGVSEGGWFGVPDLVSYESMNPEDLTYFIFQLMFCGTASTIISGAVSERMRFLGYVIITVITAGVLYPVVGHWIWNGAAQGISGGWLAQMGFLDFAGSTVVHSVGGWIALAAILIIGPRIGRFGPKGHSIEGHNVPMAVLGVFILWFGFFGFNGGSTLALNSQVPLIIANTALSGAAGGIAWLCLSWWVRKLPTVYSITNGVIAGLVAICASGNIVGEVDAVMIGLVAGLLAVAFTWVLEVLWIDDVIGAVPAHLVAGIWGTLSVALFADPSKLPAGSNLDQLFVQLAGIGAVGLFVFPVSYGLFWSINRFVPFRVPPEQERVGLNISEHDATTSLLDLVTQMDWQAQSGDFTRKVTVEPETEAAQVATFYNAVLDKFLSETQRRQEALERLNELATTDALTGLLNRRVLFDQIKRAIASNRRAERLCAVIYLDLDGFKAINDTMGHEGGDHLLKEAAVRLSDVVRENDVVARLGGDEFAILLTEVNSQEDVENIAEKVIETLHMPFVLRQGTGEIGASVGIAMVGGPGALEAAREDVESVVRRADHAMYDAKLAGKGTWLIATPFEPPAYPPPPSDNIAPCPIPAE